MTISYPKSKRRKRSHPEQDMQIALFTWIRLAEFRLPVLRFCYHCPNGGVRNKIQAAILKGMGVRPGVPDVIFPVAGALSKKGLAIELKAPKGRESAEQNNFLDHFAQEGWYVDTCHDWTVVRDILLRHLGHAT